MLVGPFIAHAEGDARVIMLDIKHESTDAVGHEEGKQKGEDEG